MSFLLSNSYYPRSLLRRRRVVKKPVPHFSLRLRGLLRFLVLTDEDITESDNGDVSLFPVRSLHVVPVYNPPVGETVRVFRRGRVLYPPVDQLRLRAMARPEPVTES